MQDIYEKLKILADSAKYDVSCSTSGTERRNTGQRGNTIAAGICHSWSADGRCISLLKLLFTNNCAYDCKYCVNRRSADVPRATFAPEELAELTMEFYRRNYIEGLFLSSAVEVSQDYTSERILKCLRILRYDYRFSGYIHAKIIPGTSRELIDAIGLEADRLSVNIEFPTEKNLKLLAPQKKTADIFSPMQHITNTLIETKSIKGPATMFKGIDLNNEKHYLGVMKDQLEGVMKEQSELSTGQRTAKSVALSRIIPGKKKFSPAGQTTQMIVGAGQESDKQIVKTSESLYMTFKMKRVYFSAYIPVVESSLLPAPFTKPPLAREHRLYQADWLLRFYGFTADEMFDDQHPFLDPELDPKTSWALRNIEKFPLEINKASFEDILRVPGIGTLSAMRIVRQRKVAAVKYEDLKRIGVVLKRAKYFITCSGKYYGYRDLDPVIIKNGLLGISDGKQLSLFESEQGKLAGEQNPWSYLDKRNANYLPGERNG